MQSFIENLAIRYLFVGYSSKKITENCNFFRKASLIQLQTAKILSISKTSIPLTKLCRVYMFRLVRMDGKFFANYMLKLITPKLWGKSQILSKVPQCLLEAFVQVFLFVFFNWIDKSLLQSSGLLNSLRFHVCTPRSTDNTADFFSFVCLTHLPLFPRAELPMKTRGMSYTYTLLQYFPIQMNSELQVKECLDMLFSFCLYVSSF